MPLTRADVQALAADAGMQVRPGVSAKLDLLVCQDPHTGTSKLRAAEKHSTVVIDQETFLAIAGASAPSPSPVAAVLSQVAARRRARIRASIPSARFVLRRALRNRNDTAGAGPSRHLQSSRCFGARRVITMDATGPARPPAEVLRNHSSGPDRTRGRHSPRRFGGARRSRWRRGTRW